MNYIRLNIGENLPEKLPDDEIYELFNKYQLGDSSAKNIIFEHNLRLVLLISNRFTNTGYEVEELFSVGTFGLSKSIDTFDLNKGIKFATYATRCVNNEILMFLRKNKKYQYNISLDDSISVDQNGNELKIGDTLYDENTDIVLNYENIEVYRIVGKIVEELQGREKEIMKLRYGFYDDKIYTQSEVAKIFDISQSYISRLEKKILKKIKKKLISYEIVDTSESDLISKKELSYCIEDIKKL